MKREANTMGNSHLNGHDCSLKKSLLPWRLRRKQRKSVKNNLKTTSAIDQRQNLAERRDRDGEEALYLTLSWISCWECLQTDLLTKLPHS
jgi:hypothetical protein